jgi:phage shock protein A
MNSRLIDQKRGVTEHEPGADMHFPSSRYFQIHFERLHEMIEDLKDQLEKTNQQIVALRQQPDNYIEKPEVDATRQNAGAGASLNRISRGFSATKRG